jgi:hypothetical protein
MSILSQFKQSQNTDFPNLRPSLDLRFALAKKLDPRITFTRGSTGTYFGSDGLMRTAGVNEPRFDHDPITGQSLGLLIEESRSNLFTYSEDFSNAVWTKSQSSIITTSIVAPNGSTAYKLVENTVSGAGHFITQGSITKLSNAVLTLTIFAKAAERQYFGLVINSFSTGFGSRYGAEFNLGNGTASEHDSAQGTYTSGSYSITPYPNGWYRCRITCTTSTDAQTQVRIFTFRDANQWTSSSSYTGDGTSGIYVWGAQVEEGAFPTSYIPTTASTVTRSADLVEMTGTNFSSWYNQSEGTLYANAKSNSNTTQIPGIAALNNSSFSSNRVDLRYYQAGNSYTFFNGVGGGGGSLPRTSGFSLTNPKFVVSYAPQNINFCVNSSLTSSRASAFVPSPLVNRLLIGNFDSGTSYYLNGTISRLTYYPIQLTNQQLINLTS